MESKPLAHQRSLLIIHVGIFLLLLLWEEFFVVVPHGFILASIFILVYFFGHAAWHEGS